MNTITSQSPQVHYLMLRNALELYHKTPAELDEKQSIHLMQQVNSQLAIGKRLLSSDDAAGVMVPERSVDKAYKALRDRFDDEDSFNTTLEYNGLNGKTLKEALKYDLNVEAVLEKVLENETEVTDGELEIYYLQHSERFRVPETRTVSHILITINDEYPENKRENALERIKEIEKECAGDGIKLKGLAARYSECPSSMKEGLIGRVKPGQLYKALDQILFTMEEGAVSEIIESEMGYHLLYCEVIHPDESLSLDTVKDKIRTHLEQKKRKIALRRRLQD